MVNIGKMHAKCKVRKTQIKGQTTDLWIYDDLSQVVHSEDE